MTVTVLYSESDTIIDDARSDGGDLWLRLDDLTRASGWRLEAAGACRGEVCVPIPAAQRNRFVRDEPGSGARLNLAELARLLGVPVLHDEPANIWCFIDRSETRSTGAAAQQAPDFSLPDIEGAPHALSDYRGRKIFLAAWASW